MAAAALVPDLARLEAVKVIGLGGVGGPVARYLAMWLAAQDADARLVLIDGDDFEPKNAARMFFSRHGNKAAVVREDLLPHVKDSRLTLAAVEEYVSPDNLRRLVRDGDVVVCCVDNHATRKLLNDHCAGLADVALLSGGNDGVEKGRRGTYGNVQLYVRAGGADQSPPLTKYHPEIADPADKAPDDRHCTELMESVPQVLFANLQVAVALLSTFWLHVCGASHYAELSFDIHDALMRPVPVPQPGSPHSCHAAQ